MYIVQFGGYTLPTDQLDMSETQGATRRAATQALGGAGGSLDSYGLGPDPLAEDTITKAFIIEAASPAALQTALDDFFGEMMLSQNDWRQGARLLLAKLPDGTYRGTWAKCVEARAMVEYFHPANAWLPVQATFRRAWPVWFKVEDLRYFGDHLLATFEDADTAGWAFDDGNWTSQAIASSPTTFTITHAGNARVMTGLIEIAGAIGTPKVENLRNGWQFQIHHTLGAGDRVTVDLAGPVCKLNGVADWSKITIGNNNGQLIPMALEPGANPMRVTGTSPSSCTFRFYWATTWT